MGESGARFQLLPLITPLLSQGYALPAPPEGKLLGHKIPRVRMASRGKRAQSYACCSAASISARYFLTLTSLTTQVKTFMAIARSSQLGKEGAMRMLLSWGSLP